MQQQQQPLYNAYQQYPQQQFTQQPVSGYQQQQPVYNAYPQQQQSTQQPFSGYQQQAPALTVVSVPSAQPQVIVVNNDNSNGMQK